MKTLQVRDALHPTLGHVQDEDAVPGAATRRIAPDCPLEQGLQELEQHGLRGVPVFGPDGVFLGAFSRDSALRALLRRERELLLHSRRLSSAASSLIGLLGEARTEEEFLQRALDCARDLLGARHAAFAHRSETGELDLFLVSGMPPEAREGLEPPTGRGLLGLELERNETLVLEDLAQHPQAAGFPPGHPPMRNLLLASVPGKAGRTGQLYFCDREDGRLFGATEDALARSLAAWLAALLEQHRSLRREVEMQHMLVQSQKMEALGRLAGCVAHDFNNLLTAIGGFAEVLLASLPAGSEDRECAREILRAAERAGRVTRQLVAVSCRQMLEPRDLELHAHLREMSSMLEVLLGERIQLVLELAAGDSWLHADPAQVEQILLNLVVNARDALSAGGTVRIRTRRLERAEVERLAGGQALGEGRRFLALEVEDDGPGMDPETLEKVFEPVFTTEKEGGTGLGLATVFGGVRQAGGLVQVTSQAGKGTRISVFLPAIEGAMDVPGQAEGPPAVRGHGERILVVEDEAHVGLMSMRALESLGYRPRLAATAREARLAVEREGAPDLLLTDLVLPDGTGEELACELRAELPSLPILFASGYSDADPPASLGSHGVDFLAKPFSRTELARRIHALLADPLPAAGGRVLVVDDESQVRDLLARFLVEAGYEVRCAADGREAEAMATSWVPQVLVCDVVMPGLTGVEVATRLRRKHPGLRAVMVSGAANAPFHLASARRLGAVASIEKPVARDALLDAVARALGHPAPGAATPGS